MPEQSQNGWAEPCSFELNGRNWDSYRSFEIMFVSFWKMIGSEMSLLEQFSI